MMKRLLVLLTAAALALSMVGTALADQKPPGQKGNGTLGYDGHPGNQSNNPGS